METYTGQRMRELFQGLIAVAAVVSGVVINIMLMVFHLPLSDFPQWLGILIGACAAWYYSQSSTTTTIQQVAKAQQQASTPQDSTSTTTTTTPPLTGA